LAIKARDNDVMMVVHWWSTLESISTLNEARRTPNFRELASLVPEG
jgi:hypothetical protein